MWLLSRRYKNLWLHIFEAGPSSEGGGAGTNHIPISTVTLHTSCRLALADLGEGEEEGEVAVDAVLSLKNPEGRGGRREEGEDRGKGRGEGGEWERDGGKMILSPDK